MVQLLEVNNLHVQVEGKEILKGVTLAVKAGEVHALMGPNGSGKSTLASVLMGHPGYEITQGSATFLGQNLLAMKPEERSRMGVFLAFQYPVAVPGLTAEHFLRTAFNAHREARGEKPLNPMDFRTLVQAELDRLQMKPELLERGLNDGFSGGEKKRLEILQLAVLKPQLAVLDETDSGLDVDAMKLVAQGVNSLLGFAMGVLVITHYQRLLHYLKPTHVHVMVNGRMAKSAGPELVQAVENSGYDQFTVAHA
ncbi:MAG: Fe-S cluster assembly ATPase SufC [Candidatus Veblenbacteria bacterium]|nr:Fe-S cluster assembly ATPase SufC [Candidatus Veblenbacteria bacterium]